MMINRSWLMMIPNDSGLGAPIVRQILRYCHKKGSNYYRHRHTDWLQLIRMGIGIIKLLWAMFENYDMPDVISTWVCCCFGFHNHDPVYVAATLTDRRIVTVAVLRPFLEDPPPFIQVARTEPRARTTEAAESCCKNPKAWIKYLLGWNCRWNIKIAGKRMLISRSNRLTMFNPSPSKSSSLSHAATRCPLQPMLRWSRRVPVAFPDAGPWWYTLWGWRLLGRAGFPQGRGRGFPCTPFSRWY